MRTHRHLIFPDFLGPAWNFKTATLKCGAVVERGGQGGVSVQLGIMAHTVLPEKIFPVLHSLVRTECKSAGR